MCRFRWCISTRSFKIPEMIEYRDKLTAKWHLDMVYGQNVEA